MLPLAQTAGYVSFALATYIAFKFARFLRQDADCGIVAKVAPTRCFRGKVIAITGASSGIGESLAYALAKRDATLILVARREAELERVLERCISLGCSPESHIVAADMLDLASHPKLVSEWVVRHTKLDMLVINHGRSQRSTVEETTIDVDRALMELNVISVMSLTHAVLPHMLRAQSGQIMVTSSVAGLVGSPCSATYSASKHAVNGYFKALNSEVLSRGVVVQIACPGPVATPIQESIFRGTLDGKPDNAPDATRRMTSTRCAELMAAQLHYKIHETWLAEQPFLLFVYLGQYCPGITWRISGEIVGPKRVAGYKSGDMGYVAVTQGIGSTAYSVIKAILGL